MKKIVTLATVLATSLTAADTISDALSEIKVDGQIRTFFVDRQYTGSLAIDRNGLATGGNIGITTGSYNGFSIGLRHYTTEQLHWFKKDTIEPSLFGDGFASYSVLGEAFLKYENGNTSVKYGKQKINTPLAGADDARMLPNLFNGIVASNKDVENLTIIAAHLTDMAAGSFSNVYKLSDSANQQLALQSGYGLGFKDAQSGKFLSMSKVALGGNINTLGVSAVAAIYKIGPVKVQAWDYVAYDILNAVYADATVSWPCMLSDSIKMSASAQIIQESGIGAKEAGEVNSLYYAAKLAADAGMISGYVALSQTGTDTATTTNGGILSPWGGMPAYTQGMVTRHQFFAGTEAAKVALVVKPLDNLKVVGYYTYFNVSSNNTYQANTAYVTTEPGFDIIYQTTKDLQLRLRGNYPNNFTTTAGWNEYRFIVNYNF